jgi:hypothetical protein
MKSGDGDPMPGESCHSAFVRSRRPEFELERHDGVKMRGIVYGWGRYVLGTVGWRTQFTRLIAPDEDPKLVHDLADRYDVRVIPHPERIRFLTGRRRRSAERCPALRRRPDP